MVCKVHSDPNPKESSRLGNSFLRFYRLPQAPRPKPDRLAGAAFRQPDFDRIAGAGYASADSVALGVI
jgi:hypothetical protein